MKPICILTVFILLLCHLHCLTEPIAPSNFNDTNSGSVENPYLINDLSNLRWLSETRSVWGDDTQSYHFLQTADIDASETRLWNNGNGFSPIGKSDFFVYNANKDEITTSSAFYGYYDGNDYSIKNIHIEYSTSDIYATDRNIGFFAILINAEIKNVRLENIQYFMENVQVGAFCNFAYKSTISNSSVTGYIVINDTENNYGLSIASGFINRARKSNIDKCYSTVSLINIKNRRTQIYGFAIALGSSIVTNSYYNGDFFNPSPISTGFVNNLQNSTIKNCYSAVNTNSQIYGLLHTPVDGCIINCFYQQSNFIKKPPFMYRLVRWLYQNKVPMHSYKGLSHKKMRKLSSYKDWDFDSVWEIVANENNGLPQIRKSN